MSVCACHGREESMAGGPGSGSFFFLLFLAVSDRVPHAPHASRVRSHGARCEGASMSSARALLASTWRKKSLLGARAASWWHARLPCSRAQAGVSERARGVKGVWRGGKVREAVFFFFVVCLRVSRSNFLFAGALLQAMTFGEL
jgi:hypothetical protein